MFNRLLLWTESHETDLGGLNRQPRLNRRSDALSELPRYFLTRWPRSVAAYESLSRVKLNHAAEGGCRQ